MKRPVHGSRHTCRPIPACSTSFTRCWWLSASRTAAPCRAATTARCAQISGAGPPRVDRAQALGGSSAEVPEESDDSLRGVRHGESPRVLTHLLQSRGVGEERANLANEPLRREHRLREHDRASDADRKSTRLNSSLITISYA